MFTITAKRRNHLLQLATTSYSFVKLMDYSWMSGPLLCVLSGLGHWFLSWVSAPCHLSTIRWKCVLKQQNVLCNFTLDLCIFQVTYRQLITSFSSVTEKDLLYAANWAVSLLQVTKDVLQPHETPFRHRWLPSLGLLGVFTQALTLVPRACR